MENEKKTYYIAIANGEIFRNATSSPWDFKITATDDEITQLREFFDENYANEWLTFVRAHIPYMEYHNDRETKRYDDKLQTIYSYIYDLGDEEAREHIASMGILPSDDSGL
ncbi:hydrolase [Neobacillus notoginsengisoli]|uniref:Hydrolase n=1 Tax=Neobacillus notoginsengisoli TaxID=1578198 RepID=A0A417YDP1_9BACI|nr:hydrolase [Neobacillus notoginsengisoli]RHW30754.1 hydrolase [Neobacillus notoginsengisoli]